MANPTIIIDAGHGGFDNGAFDNGRLEKDDNLRLAMAVGNRLEAAGFPVLYTRTTDVYQRPIDKARIANESGGDYFISFHRNSSPMRNTYSGVQTLVYDDSGIKSELASNINSELNKVGFADLGIPERKNLVVLRRTQMPAVLIETGFINTDADNELFDTRFNDIADAITRAVVETLGEDAGEDVSANMIADVDESVTANVNRNVNTGVSGNVDADERRILISDVSRNVNAGVSGNVDADERRNLIANASRNVNTGVSGNADSDASRNINGDVSGNVITDTSRNINTAMNGSVSSEVSENLTTRDTVDIRPNDYNRERINDDVDARMMNMIDTQEYADVYSEELYVDETNEQTYANDSSEQVYDEDMEWQENNTSSYMRNQADGRRRNRRPARKYYGVQVGLFRRFDNARYLFNELVARGYYVQILDKPPYYAVVVGRERDIDDAHELERSLKWDGYDTLLISL